MYCLLWVWLFDHDGDGVQNKVDHCPEQVEDLDGFQDSDGCPDFDNDADSVADPSDQCPHQSEDLDSFQDSDGCPEDE